MKDFHSIIDTLKLYLSLSSDKKILDKDVASLLDISQAKFATIKKRNKIPYKAILIFCKREHISCNKIFFD
ncbi:MAG: hypothetical protein U9P72_04400 [Campylobacterota bacterium]|nr:hypothetical protein [Campylobacterota bacterium]